MQGPLLSCLLSNHLAHIINGVYYVTKEHGEEPILGLVGEEDGIEKFLLNHPEMKDW